MNAGDLPDRALSEPVTVSAIVPTFNRPQWHARVYDCFVSQDYPYRDLWIVDDSPEPSPFFAGLKDERVHYTHLTDRLPTGSKRNRFLPFVQGALVAHFDDDDWYAPHYLSHMVDSLRATDSDLVTLGRWMERIDGQEARTLYVARQRGELWGYGFSYLYRRYVLTRVSFPAVSHWEDFPFCYGLQDAGFKTTAVQDGAELVEHLLHKGNSSRRAR
jgi:glycosyltransferase involved in cell wall biosynthesis